LLPEARALRQPALATRPLPRELDKHVLPPYLVEAGDILLVQPADVDSPVRLPGDQTVLPDGTISLGRYGQLVVAGKTVEQIQAEAQALVAAQTAGAGPIVVRVVVRQSKVYYVLGEVNAPGAFPLTGRETVLDALLAAGGLNDRASRRNIILSRPTHPDGCRVILPVCYNDIVQLGDTTTNYQIAPGDRIFVPSRWFWDDLCQRRKHACLCGGPHVCCPGPICPPSMPPVEHHPPGPVLPSPRSMDAIPHEPVPAPRPLSLRW
jgi:protein involved in polysaccharide export with SLBB domain